MKISMNFKSAKMLAVLLTCLLIITACDTGEVTGKYRLVTDEAYVGGMRLPTNAKNKKYIGNGWFYFELNSDCFIYADRNRNSVAAKATRND